MKVILGVDAISQPLTGIGRYAYELAAGLRRRRAEGIDARFFAMARWIEDPESLLDPMRPSAVLRRNIAHVPFSGVLRRLYQRASRYRFSREVRKLQGFLYHSPNFYMVPFNGPTIATIHDLSVVHHPEFHPADRVAFMGRELPAAIERSDHIIVVSDYVRQDLVETFGLAKERVSVTHLGVDARYMPRAESELEELRAYGVTPGQYCLCVATIEPRKNIGGLLAAFGSLPVSLQDRYPLVLIGDHGWKSEAIHRQIAELAARGRCKYLGYVPEAQLPLFYSGARLFAYPSFSEGFGLPVLEAMASGVPVITSNRSSLPEVAGGAALLVDPMAEDALRDGMEQLLEDEQARGRAVEAGQNRAAAFTWPRFVDETLAVYRQVAADHGLAGQ